MEDPVAVTADLPSSALWAVPLSRRWKTTSNYRMSACYAAERKPALCFP